MSKFFKYALAYGLWFVDLGLATWLLFVIRSVLLALIAFLFDPSDYQYPKRAEVADKVITLLLGIGWLAFMAITEGYFRTGVLKENLMKRFAKVTGPMLLCIFILNLVLFWLQGVDIGDGLRWLVLLAVLLIGLLFVVYSRKKPSKIIA